MYHYCPHCESYTTTIVSLKHIFSGETVGYGFICIITALIVRMIVAALVSFGVGLNKTEKAYVSICWVPKGTVQVGKVGITNEMFTL